MLKYIIKRILLAIVILLGVSLIIYILLRSMPSDFVDSQFAAQISTGLLSESDIADLKALYGLGDDSFWGLISGYFQWLVNVVQFDLGTSFKYMKPVEDVILENMWVSFFIAAVAMFFQFAIAIPLGVTAATHQYSTRDYVITVLVMVGISLPSFFFAAILIKVVAVDLGWLPIGGQGDAGSMATGILYVIENVKYMVLPIVTLVAISIGGLMRYTRTNTLEVLNADYIRTARAKGLKESKVIYKHAFRNTLIPLATLLAGILPGLFSGAMIIEQVFAIEGIGNLAYKAMIATDIPFIMGYNMFLATLTVLGTLLSDIMYVIVDPRVKLT